MADEQPKAAPPPKPSGKPAAAPGRGFPVRLVVVALIALYAVLFVVMNSDQVEVSFVFFTASIALVVALLLAIVLGFVLGFAADNLLERRRRRPAAKD